MAEKRPAIIFPVGYHKFHSDQGFNFQLNRWYSLGIARLEDLEEAGRNIKAVEDWKHTLLGLGDTAAADNRFVNHLLAITNLEVPIDAFDILLQFNEENLQSEKVTQDVLILTGNEDHMIPLKTHHLQVKALTKANSVTARIFTQVDQAQNHCQVGNLGLALDVMQSWIQEKSSQMIP